jgi:hypothetical protein
MAEDYRQILVPAEFLPAITILVKELRQAADEPQTFDKEEVTLIQPDARQFGVGEIPPAVLYLSATAVGWITKAWVDKHLMPIIIDAIPGPSEKFTKWFKDALGVRK